MFVLLRNAAPPILSSLNTAAPTALQCSIHLEIDVTIDDSKAYTRPWTVRVNQRLIPGDQLIEFVCNENERSSKHYVN